MKTSLSVAGLAVATLVAMPFFTAFAEEASEQPGEKIMCPISNKKAKASATAEHAGGKVYFCCGNCVKAFNKDPKKFATKANFQLVATKQAEQVGCPISGRDTKDGTAIKIGEEGKAQVSVAFCCNNCKGKAVGAEGDKQLEMLFSKAAFEKGFKVKKDEDEG